MEAEPTPWRTIFALSLDHLLSDNRAHGCFLGDEVSIGALRGPGSFVPECQASTHERGVHGFRATMLLDGDQFEARMRPALIQQREGLAVAMKGRPHARMQRACRLCFLPVPDISHFPQGCACKTRPRATRIAAPFAYTGNTMKREVPTVHESCVSLCHESR